MYVDSLTISALADEFNTLLTGGRVQSVLEVDPLSIGLEIYGSGERRYLLISAHPDSARCSLVSDKLRRGVEVPSTLSLLLKKYVDGGRLRQVSQPAWERILWLDFSSEEGETRLILELMDRRSNIILTAENIVLDSIKRITPDLNRRRVIMPNKRYELPPPQSKLSPDALESSELESFLREAGDELAWKLLVRILAGISPLAAREIVFQATGDSTAPAFDIAAPRLIESLASLLAMKTSGGWSPCVVSDSSGEGYQAFAAYPLHHLGEIEPVGTISEAMERYFGAPVREEAYEAGKSKARTQLANALDRSRRKIESLERQLIDQEALETLRKQGELILAYGVTFSAGQTVLRTQYDPDGPDLIIELDPALSPSENARRYFDRYEKAKRAGKGIPALLKKARYEAAFLDQLSADLDMAENWPDIQAVREIMQKEGYWSGGHAGSPRGGKPGVRRFVSPNGFVVLVGRNAVQNHALITEQAGPADLWLHARNIPGSHVIIRVDGRPVPDPVIGWAAGLAAYYSTGRGEATVEVVVTERRYVRPVKGGGPGLVRYKNEKTLQVKPLRPEKRTS